MQPVLYRSCGTELPQAGPDGHGDLEAGAEVYFDVSSCSFICLLGISNSACKANLLSNDGSISLTEWAFSPDEKYFAYSLSRFVCSSRLEPFDRIPKYSAGCRYPGNPVSSCGHSVQ